MTLAELSAEYRRAAKLLSDRLAEIRSLLRKTEDPEEIWHLKHRIAELTPMLTQMNDLAWMLDHYYERSGADRDYRYGFNGIRKPKENQRNADEDLAPGLARRINRLSAENVLGLPLRGEDRDPNRSRTRREQEHGLPDAEAGRAKSSQDYEVLVTENRSVLDKFFNL